MSLCKRLLNGVCNHPVRLLLLNLLFWQLGEVAAQDPNFHIYLCFGQSNMAGAGDIETQDRTVDPRFQFMKPQDCASKNQLAGNWYPAVPPLWGCNGGIGPADYFGRTLVANLPTNVKVGVVVVGIPGCKIELFGKTGFQGQDTYNNVPSKYAGSAYAWLVDLAKQAQKTGVIKGILLHQGESNSGDQAWPTKVKGVYDNLIKDLGLEASKTPLLAGELLYQNYGSCCSGHNAIIAKLPSVLPNSHVISASGLPGKDVYHFNSAAVRTFGQRYAQKMLTLLPKGAPLISITSPVNNSIFTTSQTITLNATASDADGTVSKVEFFDGSILLGTDNTAPYNYTWIGAAAGIHSISAKATDNTGLSTSSVAVTVTVQGIQSPFKGSPFSIPGRIEAEEYDQGGEGVAFHEANTNGNESGATFRNDQVDIETTSDGDGEFNIGYVLQGEWLEYTVHATTTSMYNLHLRMASEGAGKILHVEMDGINLTGPITVPNTNGWQTWTTVTVPTLPIPQGQHILRLVFDANYMNVNYFEFKANLSTGLEQKDQVHAVMYPNPFGEEGLMIEKRGVFHYKIMGMDGTVLENGTSGGKQSVGTRLPLGLYFLLIEQNGSSSSYKIVKQ